MNGCPIDEGPMAMTELSRVEIMENPGNIKHIRRQSRRVFVPEATKHPDASYISEESNNENEEQPDFTAPDTSIKLIRITRPFRTRWDLFTMVLALYNCLTVPFFVAFYEDDNWIFFTINTCIDVIFIIDIVLNFMTTYVDRNGDEITDHKKIVNHYFKGFFWLDLVASLPVDNFYVMFASIQDNSQFIQLSDLLKLVRILRLGRIIRFTRTRDDLKAAMKLLQLTLYLVMWVHLTGCIWFLLIKHDREWVPVPDFNNGPTDFYDTNIWKQYFTCFYHAVWLLTGGEVGPQTSLQAFVASMLIIIGALITAVLFGEMAVLMSNLNRRQTKIQEILDGALTTMNNMKLSEKLTNKILDYITSTQNSLSQQEEYDTFQKFISPSLQQKVSACIYEPIIQMNYILQDEDRLKTVLIHRLHNKFCKPEDEIITEGDKANSLYFLVNGECKVYVSDKDRKKCPVCYLKPGAHFGEIGVVYDTVRSATVEGIGYCTIAELSKKDYESLVNTFPNITNKFRRCTEVYQDPWKLYLISILEQADYFQALAPTIFNELVYFMEVVKLERGQYLFKPGETVSAMYILTEGELELSLTINEKHLHLLKQKAKLQDIEQPPAVPKKNTNLYDYSDYKFDIFTVEGLKSKADLVTVVNTVGVVGSIRIDDEVPENTQLIGDYPQEIEIDTLQPGTLLYPNFCLLKDTHQLQCKALRNCTVYLLRTDIIETLCKENGPFQTEIQDKKQELEELNRKRQVDLLDYYYDNKKMSRYMWKSLIVRVILSQREERKQGASKFANMVTKVQAINACELAGNFDLADKVMRGEIPPHYIMEDGTLDPAASNSDINASLPRNHPIIKAFRNIFDSLSQPTGGIVKQFTAIENTVNEQNKKLKIFDRQVSEMKNKMLMLVDNMGDDLPFKEGKNLQMLKYDLQLLLQAQEENRAKLRKTLVKKDKKNKKL